MVFVLNFDAVEFENDVIEFQAGPEGRRAGVDLAHPSAAGTVEFETACDVGVKTGVQFHPESIASEHGHALLRNFLDLATTGRVAA